MNKKDASYIYERTLLVSWRTIRPAISHQNPTLLA